MDGLLLSSRWRHVFQRIVDTLVDKFASADIALVGQMIDELHFLTAYPDGDGLLLVCLGNKVLHQASPLTNSVFDNMLIL